MKRVILAAGLLLAATAFVLAQETIPAAENLGTDTAQQKLKEISLNKFEDPGFWHVYMPLDQGVVTVRRFEGSPLPYDADKNPMGKKAVADETAAGIAEADKFALGVKAEFFGRANTTISVEPSRPIAVPGIAKLISVWVIGRNFNHVLKVVVEDNFGNRCVLPMGKMNFSGWKKLTVAVPPNLVQRNPHYSNLLGIKIIGFVVEPELTETYGNYFIYFDDLRVVSDLFSEESRDPDDLPDNW